MSYHNEIYLGTLNDFCSQDPYDKIHEPSAMNNGNTPAKKNNRITKIL